MKNSFHMKRLAHLEVGSKVYVKEDGALPVLKEVTEVEPYHYVKVGDRVYEYGTESLIEYTPEMQKTVNAAERQLRFEEAVYDLYWNRRHLSIPEKLLSDIEKFLEDNSHHLSTKSMTRSTRLVLGMSPDIDRLWEKATQVLYAATIEKGD